MFASSLLAAASLLLATALADSSPYSKFVEDANAILAAATGKDAAQLDAINSWQATQTALPSADIDAQYQDYLDAYMTATSAPLPTWVTAIPSSLQAVATSFLKAEASLVLQDIAPIVSQYNADLSASPTAQATPTTIATPSSSNNTVVSTSAPIRATASSSFATLPANATAAQVSGTGTAISLSANGTGNAPMTPIGSAGGTPTKSVTPPVGTFGTSGAEKPAGVAVVAALIGVLGMIVLL